MKIEIIPTTGAVMNIELNAVDRVRLTDVYNAAKDMISNHKIAVEFNKNRNAIPYEKRREIPAMDEVSKEDLINLLCTMTSFISKFKIEITKEENLFDDFLIDEIVEDAREIASNKLNVAIENVSTEE